MCMAGAAESFLGSIPAVSKDLGFLPVPCRIQILFLPGMLGRAAVGSSGPLFTPPVIVSFLPHLKKESAEENHLFHPRDGLK